MKVKKKEHLKLEKNSGLYFAIGMTLILALVYTALEWKTFDKGSEKVLGQLKQPDDIDETVPPIIFNTPPPPPKIQIPVALEVKDDDADIIEDLVDANESNQDTPIVPLDKVQFDDLEVEPDVTWVTIEEVPVFPGCENSGDKRACFQEMMQKHIRKNFKYPENAIDMNVRGKVYLQFTVQKDGSIGEMKMRSPHKLLGDEAARIISKLPKMQPGKQRDKAVKVPFSIPIIFRLQ